MSGGFPRTSSFKSSKIQAPSTRETPSSNCQAGPCRLPVGETADKLSALRACGLPGFMAPMGIQFWRSGLPMNRPKIWGGQRWERIQKQSLSCPNLWVCLFGSWSQCAIRNQEHPITNGLSGARGATRPTHARFFDAAMIKINFCLKKLLTCSKCYSNTVTHNTVMLPFTVQIEDGLPVSDQIVQSVRKAMLTGQLRTGDEFPSVRTLSQELRISPTTAHKVVATLKDSG